MSPLRRRMIDDMQIPNLTPNTQRVYVAQVFRFACPRSRAVAGGRATPRLWAGLMQNSIDSIDRRPRSKGRLTRQPRQRRVNHLQKPLGGSLGADIAAAGISFIGGSPVSSLKASGPTGPVVSSSSAGRSASVSVASAAGSRVSIDHSDIRMLCSSVGPACVSSTLSGPLGSATGGSGRRLSLFQAQTALHWAR